MIHNKINTRGNNTRKKNVGDKNNKNIILLKVCIFYELFRNTIIIFNAFLQDFLQIKNVKKL